MMRLFRVAACAPAVALTFAISGCAGTGRLSPNIPSQARPAAVARAAGTYKLLYTFTGGSDGANPLTTLTDLDGKLYGTTNLGGGSGCRGRGCGTVFSIAASGAESVLHSFAGGSDGQQPRAGLINVGGTLYGTTEKGGGACPSGCGTVFKITRSGNESVLYHFRGRSDGLFPWASLIEVDGALYGMTRGWPALSCGDGGCGTVFKLTASGKESVLHRFQGGSDGSTPDARLVEVGGRLYGTTTAGGSCGTIFAISKSGKESILYAFHCGSDGGYPGSGLTNVGGTLYGTTASGGSSCGCGTVFKVSTSGAETVLHRFQGGSDGAVPDAGLTDVGGTLYGTTSGGGAGGSGTVFSITTSGAESVLYSFGGGSDGSYPTRDLLNVGGRLYGATYMGGGTGCGGSGCGTVFSIKP
jgi:uncharacterized repeat protein (TIGR03803 family)